jgi:hypothetical protein
MWEVKFMDKDSVLNIMNMVKDGTITPEEATDLLEALSTDKEVKNAKNARRKNAKLVVHITPKNEKGKAADISIPFGISKGFVSKLLSSKGIDFDLEEIEKDGIHIETDDETVDIHMES